MFAAPLTTKTQTPVRSSTARRLKAFVVQHYLAACETKDGSSLSSEEAMCVARAAVPDGMKCVPFKIDRKHKGALYISQKNEPLWFSERDAGDVIPTLYTLWILRLLPIVTVTPGTMKSILNNKDVHFNATYPSVLQSGTLVGVASETDPNVPLAVAKVDPNGSDNDGPALTVCHTWRDNLWKLGSGSTFVPSPAAPTVRDVLEKLQKSDESSSSYINEDDLSPSDLSETDEPQEQEYELTTGDIDDTLRLALVHCISRINLDNIKFPITASLFFSNHVLPCRRFSFDHLASNDLYSGHELMRCSSYGKLTKLFAAAEERGLLRLKKNHRDTLVLSVDTEHPDVPAIEDRHLLLKDVEQARQRRLRDEEEEREASSRHCRTVTVEDTYFKPKNNDMRRWLTEAFECIKDLPGVRDSHPPGGDDDDDEDEDEDDEEDDSLFERRQVKFFLDVYVGIRKLVRLNDPSFIRLDPPLRAALNTSFLRYDDCADGSGRLIPMPQKGGNALDDFQVWVKKHLVLNMLMGCMNPWHITQKATDDLTDTMIKRLPGRAKPVQVEYGQRRGGVTFVRHYEAFHIDPQALVHSLTRSCGTRATVRDRDEKYIEIKGDHRKAVIKYLLDKGVPSRWIQVYEYEDSKDTHFVDKRKSTTPSRSHRTYRH